MKQFFKMLLASMLGTLCVFAFFAFMSFVMLAAMIAAGGSQTSTSVDKGSVLRISLDATVEERAAEANPFDEFMGNAAEATLGLDETLKAIKLAKDNKNISGIYLDGGALASDFASLEELHKALLDFKKSGKFIAAYADTYTQAGYYLAATADAVMLNPSGMVDWHGLAAQPMFFKEMLEKIGVKMQVFRVGTYKSAVEPFTQTEMSPANREQVTSYINDIWNTMCADVAADRKLTPERMKELADNYIGFAETKDFVANKLVDTLTYIDGARAKLRTLAKQEKLNLVSPADVIAASDSKDKGDEIAVYYAYGDIVDEAGTASLMGGNNEIVGSTLVEDFDELAEDEDVKAVVIRINSGGGSAYASEQIWHAVELLKAKKPVVVSMGGMAASGGYYMACGANKIFADPTTLTGSIGIFGMIPDASGLLTEKLGLHFDVAKTSEAADFGAAGRPFNEKESAVMQAYIERGYKLFLSRVAAGRNMPVAAVDSIAQGRVWTGRQALAIKLVDQLGTLDDAIAEAARLAKSKEYYTADYPAPSNWMDNLMSSTGSDYMESRVKDALGIYYQPLRFVGSLSRRNALQARIPYLPNIQ